MPRLVQTLLGRVGSHIGLLEGEQVGVKVRLSFFTISPSYTHHFNLVVLRCASVYVLGGLPQYIIPFLV